VTPKILAASPGFISSLIVSPFGSDISGVCAICAFYFFGVLRIGKG
jgi:hypothetical protein